MGLEGIFGVPLDVAATYIVLFAIYGAVLEFSGAARFFVEISLRRVRALRTGPGRTSALAGFLLGTVSGSGVATTVTLGSVAWPLLRKAGISEGRGRRDHGRLRDRRDPLARRRSAPPRSSSPRSSRSATCRCWSTRSSPSVLYYVGILLAIEADARRHHVKGLDLETPGVAEAAGPLGLPLLERCS